MDENLKKTEQQLDSESMKGAKNRRLILGILLVIGGLFYLSIGLGIFPESWNINAWRFWPLIVVFAGLGMISAKHWFSIIIGIITAVIIIGLAALAIFYNVSK
ncbi:MAG: hypothetical protein WC459_02880 [Patescibacteria group bacterium]